MQQEGQGVLSAHAEHFGPSIAVRNVPPVALNMSGAAGCLPHASSSTSM